MAASNEQQPGQAGGTQQSAPPTGRPAGRAGATLRDMIGAVAVLLAMVGAVVGVTRACAFSPGGPTVDPSAVPSVDAGADLRGAASVVSFPVRLPSLPPEWRANSSSTSPVGSGALAAVVVRVGWLTPQGRFVQLSQSSAGPADLVAAETDRVVEAPRTGLDVAGARWEVYSGRREETVWVTRRGEATLLITGTGDEAEFRTLATAVLAATPLPRG